MSNPFFRVAVRGGDALADAQKDLAFDAGLNYMIILEERTDTSDGSNDLTINHGLGYIPAFYTFFNDGSGKWYRQIESGLGGSYADSSNIYIKTDNPSQQVRTVIFANSQDDSVGSGRNNASGRLRVAKPGYDAEIDTDLRRFRFASGGGVFKIKENKEIIVTVNVDGDGNSDDEITYAHGLGYVPQVYVFLGGQQIPIFQFIAAGMSYSVDFTIDSTNLTVKVISSGDILTDGDQFTFNVQILLDKIA
jgi:hypothetical protein